MTEWRLSGPEPGKDRPRAAEIAINRPEIRNVSLPTPLFELSNEPGAPVIILTAASCPDGHHRARTHDGDVSGFARFLHRR